VPSRRLLQVSDALLGCGLLVVVCSVLWQLGLVPGSVVVLPRPVAFERATATSLPALPTFVVTPRATTAAVPVAVVHTPVLEPTPAPAPTAAVAATPLPAPTPAALPDGLPPADAADRIEAAMSPQPGYAVRLSIPSIKLDTAVEQGGIVPDEQGNPVWQTLPFVAVHYGDLTALVGARGNAVISGHVVTLREGNVFHALYQVNLDDAVQVWDEREREHTFRITDVKLVPPTDVSPMARTLEPTLTLITCGGGFDAVKREFSHRLIVTARPV